MRVTWRRLVQMAIIVFLLWIVFNLLVFYYKSRKASLSGPGSDFPVNHVPFRLSQSAFIHKQQHSAKSKALEPRNDYVLRFQTFQNADPLWKKWLSENRATQTLLCDGRFMGYHSQFALLRQVVVDPKLASGRRGGEEIKAVLNQPEHKEFFKFLPGFFKLPCRDPIYYEFQLGGKNHLNNYMQALGYMKRPDPTLRSLAPNKTVFVVTRYEYVNIYHSMTDFFNAFLQMTFFDLKPEDIVVLFADAHPKGGLDSVWSTLFSDYVRLGSLREPFSIQKMVWVQLSYLSPLIAHSLHSIPATEGFRDFFLRRYNISGIHRSLNCSRVRVLFIWRRDYLAHPRNPSGHVVRKIKNEDELVAEVKHEISSALVYGEQIDLLPMHKQLQLIADADILVGMHGAGLTHALFLPRHGGLVEMYPTYWSEGNVHFKKIAEWRHIHYQHWVNHNPRLEYANHYTRIPPGVVSSMIRQVLHAMSCSKHQHN